jgi:transcriptional regulator with XRE-family HTH domain
MSDKDGFGLRLRAARQRSGLSLERIADQTKVRVSLWVALERSDLAHWPTGLFARACVRDYAVLVGLDPDETVDEFCRLFPNGDRRVGRLLRGEAELVGLESEYRDDCLPAGGEERRAAASPTDPRIDFLRDGRTQRAVGAACDMLASCGVALAASSFLKVDFLPVLGVVTLAYYSLAAVLLGRSPGLAVAALLGRRLPQLLRVREPQLHA